jgi:hypothetical protein
VLAATVLAATVLAATVLAATVLAATVLAATVLATTVLATDGPRATARTAAAILIVTSRGLPVVFYCSQDAGYPSDVYLRPAKKTLAVTE